MHLMFFAKTLRQFDYISPVAELARVVVDNEGNLHGSLNLRSNLSTIGNGVKEAAPSPMLIYKICAEVRSQSPESTRDSTLASLMQMRCSVPPLGQHLSYIRSRANGQYEKGTPALRDVRAS